MENKTPAVTMPERASTGSNGHKRQLAAYLDQISPHFQATFDPVFWSTLLCLFQDPRHSPTYKNNATVGKENKITHILE